MLTRYIRIDDFPNGDLALHTEWLKYHKKPHFKLLKPILDILNESQTGYILGVSPELCDSDDINFLNDNIQGSCVMHGFNHAWNFPWANITDTWPLGGEFGLLSKQQISEKYKNGVDTLSKIKNVNFEHFIPPFNCYNQDLLDVLAENNVKYIHGCSKEHENYGLEKLNHFRIHQVISEWQKTYCDVDKVINYAYHPSQITLHWIYDVSRDNYLQNYKTLARIIK